MDRKDLKQVVAASLEKRGCSVLKVNLSIAGMKTQKRRPRILLIVLAVMLTIQISIIPVYADMGPKASTTVEISGLDGKYCATLLSPQAYYGPWNAEQEWAEVEGFEGYTETGWNAFKEYADPDGYYFIGYMDSFDGPGKLAWTYMRPDKFKVLIYSEDSGTYYSSEPMECYAFASEYKAVVSGDKLIVTEGHNAAVRIGALVFRIAATIAIELMIAVFFGFKARKQILAIVLVNLVTQCVLNIMLLRYQPVFAIYVLNYATIELVVFALEACAYTFFFNKDCAERIKPRKIILYSLVANAASFILGYLISMEMPGLFI